MPLENNHTEQKVDIAVLKERVDKHDDFMLEMRENHLPHIYNRLVRIETRMAWYAGAVVAALGIIQFVADYFLK